MKIPDKMQAIDPDKFLRALLSPISLVEKGLYIGNREGARDLDLLKAYRIRRVVQIQNFDTQPFHPGHFNYLRFHLADFPQSDISTLIPNALTFIAQGLAAEEPVFVHCDAGASRSGSVIVAYLMGSRGLNYDEALVAAREARTCIQPNSGFEAQLRSMTLESLSGYLRAS